MSMSVKLGSGPLPDEDTFGKLRTQIAKVRKDPDDRPIAGWSAADQPAYSRLVAVLDALKELAPEHDADGVAEIGSDYNDEEGDSLSIVWAAYPYFTDGGGSLRDMRGWIAADDEKYWGCNLTGSEFEVPFGAEAAKKAALMLLEDDEYE